MRRQPRGPPVTRQGLGRRDWRQPITTARGRQPPRRQPRNPSSLLALQPRKLRFSRPKSMFLAAFRDFTRLYATLRAFTRLYATLRDFTHPYAPLRTLTHPYAPLRTLTHPYAPLRTGCAPLRTLTHPYAPGAHPYAPLRTGCAPLFLRSTRAQCTVPHVVDEKNWVSRQFQLVLDSVFDVESDYSYENLPNLQEN